MSDPDHDFSIAPEDAEAPPGFIPLNAEPPLAPDDTQPRAPTGVHTRVALDEPPLVPDADTAPVRFVAEPQRALLYLTVMLGMLCLCLAMVGLAGFAGYRDGLATNDAKVTQTLATGIAQQHATGVADLEQGFAELAAMRFEWIVETVRPPTQYALDSQARLEQARTEAAVTATPSATLSPAPSPTAPPTAAPTAGPTEPATATVSSLQDPAYLYEQAQTSMRLNRYEAAIEWLDALRALDPAYREPEVTAALIEALTRQGSIYLRGQNTDGEDRLMRGVTLIYRADDLGTIDNRVLGEAIFAEDYINARNYVSGGYYAQALPILEDLCNRNCGWGYPSLSPVTVRDLLDRARAGGN